MMSRYACDMKNVFGPGKSEAIGGAGALFCGLQNHSFVIVEQMMRVSYAVASINVSELGIIGFSRLELADCMKTRLHESRAQGSRLVHELVPKTSELHI
jgi:hypothetical protein